MQWFQPQLNIWKRQISEGVYNPTTKGLVLSSTPKVFGAESDRFIGGPDKISGSVVGVIVGIPTDKPWIAGVYIAINQV